MSSSDYVTAWLLYLLASAGLTYAVVLAAKHYSLKESGRLLALVVAVFLLTPYYAGLEQTFLAPAWVMVIMEAIEKGEHTAWRAGMPLLISLLVAVVAATGFEFWQRRRAGGAVAMSAENAINDPESGVQPPDTLSSSDH